MRQIVPCDPNWPIVFKKVKEYILNFLPDLSIEHIGSTAVPGLSSKHMIDLLIIASNQDLQVVKKSLIDLGFHERDIWVDTDEKPYVGGSLIYDSRVYDINVHICRNGSQTHVQTLMFREALLAEKKLRHKYERLKHEAIENAGTDPKAYNDYKSSFILEVIESQNKANSADAKSRAAD
ncbi:MAG: GrpB family protein [Desulfobacterales bacterium]|nr:GrpB family protein [Desulfobacterales bacterium]